MGLGDAAGQEDGAAGLGAAQQRVHGPDQPPVGRQVGGHDHVPALGVQVAHCGQGASTPAAPTRMSSLPNCS